MRFIYGLLFLAIALTASPATAQFSAPTKAGEQVWLMSWCGTRAHLDKIIEIVLTRDEKLYDEFILSGESSCLDIAVSNQFGMKFSPIHVIVLEVLDVVTKPGYPANIELLKTKSLRGMTLYSWNYVKIDKSA